MYVLASVKTLQLTELMPERKNFDQVADHDKARSQSKKKQYQLKKYGPGS